MLARIGRKFIQGAKAELQENPPELETILDTGKTMDLVETLLSLGILALTIFGMNKAPKTPVTVIVNNYITKG